MAAPLPSEEGVGGGEGATRWKSRNSRERELRCLLLDGGKVYASPTAATAPAPSSWRPHDPYSIFLCTLESESTCYSSTPHEEVPEGGKEHVPSDP
jgi:hypothetical protein